MADRFGNLRNAGAFRKNADRQARIPDPIPFHTRHHVPIRLPLQLPGPEMEILTGLTHSLDQVVFFDTETTGLSGGAGTLIFQSGVAVPEADGLTVHQYFLSSPAEEPEMLHQLAEHFRMRPVVVTYNGRTFDMPLLKTRYILNRMTEPAVQVVDLLHAARFIWRYRLSGFRLADVEQHILGIRRRGDLPGALVPGVYRDYLLGRDRGQAKEILRHNLQDVLSLAALINRIREGCEGGQDPDIRYAMARKRFQERDHAGCVSLLEPTRDHSFPDRMRSAVMWTEAAARKRMGDMIGAARIWRQMDSVPASIELAKYLEHVEQDVRSAWNVTCRALRHPDVDRRTARELGHRRNRLERKLEISKTKENPRL